MDLLRVTKLRCGRHKSNTDKRYSAEMCLDKTWYCMYQKHSQTTHETSLECVRNTIKQRTYPCQIVINTSLNFGIPDG